MTSDALRPILLIGSVPLGTVQEVFETAGQILAGVAPRIPDGEAQGWVNFPIESLNRAVGIELVASDTDSRLPMAIPKWRIKAGLTVADVHFAPTGYVERALQSYETFKLVRSTGKIAAGTRFQVSLPTPFAVIALAIIAQETAAILPRYEQHVFGEVMQIADAIPHEDLAIQWDVAVEVIEVLEGFHQRLAEDFPLSEFAPILARACNCVPGDIEMGVHLCYGNPGGKHIIEPKDTANMVDFANRFTPLLNRPLAWLHMPVPIGRDDDAYFTPLKALVLPPESQLYLGLVHPADGVEGAKRRLSAAKKVAPYFGIGTECGLRYFPPKTIRDLLTLHRNIAGLD